MCLLLLLLNSPKRVSALTIFGDSKKPRDFSAKLFQRRTLEVRDCGRASVESPCLLFCCHSAFSGTAEEGPQGHKPIRVFWRQSRTIGGSSSRPTAGTAGQRCYKRTNYELWLPATKLREQQTEKALTRRHTDHFSNILVDREFSAVCVLFTTRVYFSAMHSRPKPWLVFLNFTFTFCTKRNSSQPVTVNSDLWPWHSNLT